jgi:hypothetical protein
MYTSKKYERESDSKDRSFSKSSTKSVSVIKRLLVLMVMTFCLAAAGASSAPTTNASAGCELVCGEPFIGKDGQCYQQCCPQSKECMNRCEIQSCK